jgi:hypothetical protein
MELKDIWPTLGSGVEDGAFKQPSATKRGPGRKHHAGHKKAPPIKAKGAGVGFVQHTNEAANTRRKAKAEFGARQYRRACKALSFAAREAA